MTLYAPSDVRAILVPQERGGCGQPHEAGTLAEGEHFAITCPECEAHVNTLGHGWAPDPLQVAMTPDERAQFEALSKQAQARQATTWADPDAIGKAVATALGVQAQPTSLLDQLRALSPDDKAALAGILGLTPPAEKGDKPAAVIEPAPAEEQADKPAAAPVKKAPPKKAATPPAA